MEVAAGNPPPIQVPLIEADVHCVKCQYNLRTRPVGDRCPECGAAIGETLAHQKMYAGAILEPTTLRLAAYCFGLPSLLSMGAYVGLAAFRAYEGPGAATTADLLLEYGCHIVFVAALLLGVFLLGGSVTKVVASPATRILLALLAALYGAINVFFSLLAVMALFYGRARPLPIWAAQTTMLEQRLGTAIMCLVMALAGIHIMQKLAHALASARLRTLTRWAFGAMIADAGITLVILLVMGVAIPRRDPNRFANLFAGIDLASAAMYAGFGWYWLIVARTVRERTRRGAVEMVAAGAGSAVGAEEKVRAFLARRDGGRK